jgi:hypothetical protein
LANGIFEPLAEGRFARQQRDAFDLYSAIRALYPMDLNDHCRQQRTPGQIPYLSLAKVMIILELPPTAGTHQLPIPPLPADPKTKALARFIDLMPVHPVPRPLQDFREIVVCHLDSLAKRPHRGKARQINAFTDSCGEPIFPRWNLSKEMIRGKAHCGHNTIQHFAKLFPSRPKPQKT